ncbi:unnamed protein product [Brachionus calyciflorus]|uniref:Pseudouridine synthase I TruA alpha/beta domain-containing protein n=1 Tax=Brachionus calyciflorus TaxID=104777 RepID=A0A814JTE3_9BILA|nr:unnamed protein product [Brachionus calyciflorus]
MSEEVISIIDEPESPSCKKLKTEHIPTETNENTDIIKSEEKCEAKTGLKRKYALCIGYCEDEIVDGLVKVNSIPQAHADEMFKMSFQRAARTDKGVSAAENLISLKMEFTPEHLKQLNEVLPKQIRVFGYKKVTKSFDSKNNCDGRTYIYILPTFAFCPIEEFCTENYRAPEEVIDKVNETLRILCGTHNFHNFTAGRKYTDPSSKRYIISFECSKPFLKEGYEYAVIKVRGQSFMLHQIRKMIGMVIAIVRGFANMDTLDLCWTANKVDVPTAPALGLMLDKLHYDKYNKKFGKDGIHEPIEWSHLEQEIENFKHEYIFTNIIQKEKEKKSMFNWLSKLPINHYGILDPKYMRGYYTGIGRALYKIDCLNKELNNKNPAEEDDDSTGCDD